MEIRRILKDEYESFLREKEYAVILFDAPWDTCGRALRPRFERAACNFAGHVNFGEIDCDELVDVAESIPIVNVPTVADYKDGGLIAALISVMQNVNARTEAMLVGKRISPDDGWNIDEEGKALSPGRKPSWFPW